MPPEALALATFVIQQGIKHAPQIKEAIQAVLSKEDPTDADFEALRKRIADADYFKFVPQSELKQ